MPQESEALSLTQFFGVVRRRWMILALCALVVAGAAFVASKRQTKQYTATASLVFKSDSLSQEIAGLPSSGSFSSSAQLAAQASDLELVRGGDAAAKTASALGHGLTAAHVAAIVSVSAQGESGVIEVTATTTSPALAAEIVNTYAGEFVQEQQAANSQYLKSALAVVHKQLAALSRQQRIGPDGLQLQNRAQTLALLSELSFSNVQVAQKAFPPSAPSSPKTSRNTGLGLVFGLVLGLITIMILERLDRRIRQAQDLEAIYRVPLLGSVPKSAAILRHSRTGSKKRTPLPPAEAEAFGLLDAHLRFLNADRRLRTVMIASPASGEGKTTIARHLAEAAATLGVRVLLLEADLRKPALASQLDIDPGPGLAAALNGEIPISEAIMPVELGASAGGDPAKARTLDVLAAGALLPPNPAELLGSQAMDVVLDLLRSEYDLVVIDTPPLTAVSDAFPLLGKVDGVLAIGWVGRSRREAAEALHRILASSGAVLLGVVANGWKSSVRHAYSQPADGVMLATSAKGASQPPKAQELIPMGKA